ncbi:MAG: tail fiber domain-containing protein, partial [Bacteroidetes bacterium]|nr:tail fiber domain-containing protein [Bacteroidota bacterium]
GTTGNAEQWGYRPWQKNGITFTGNEDQGYVGQKYRHGGGTGETDMVMQWSDNPGNWKGDRLRFIFTGGYNSTEPTGRKSEEGEEGMRLYPTVDKGINVGIGDFFAGNYIDPVNVADPTERLDVLDGRVRIRQLPDDQEATELTKFLVVDDTPSPSGERGVVKWRYLPPSSNTCDWELNSGSHLLTTAWRVPGTNGNCPDRRWLVGIGTQVPNYKLVVKHDYADQAVSGGVYVDYTGQSSNYAYGLFSDVKPQTGSSLQYPVGVRGNVVGVDGSGYGLQGIVHAGALDGTTDLIHGTSGQAWGPTNGSVLSMSCGAYGESFGQAGGTISTSYGLWGKSSGSGIGDSYGVYAWGRDGSTNYGVYGRASNGTTNWAGYFVGDVNSTGIGYYVNGIFVASDTQFKTNVQPLDDPMSVISQLQPHQYDYLVDAYPQMNFPSGQQVGLLAQEVETVVPALVRATRVEATTDSAGVEVTPAVEYKAVNYAGLVPYLIGAVQQQQQQIAAMQAQLDQCCASNPGMAPEGSGGLKNTPATGELREQHLLIIPNPVADLTTLEYYVPMAGKVVLQVSTIDGKPLATLREEMAEPGAYQYTWNTNKLVPGTYLCTYMLDGAVVVQKAVKVAR